MNRLFDFYYRTKSFTASVQILSSNDIRFFFHPRRENDYYYTQDSIVEKRTKWIKNFHVYKVNKIKDLNEKIEFEWINKHIALT